MVHRNCRHTTTNMAETEVLIPLRLLEDHLQCAICLQLVREASLTGCGHRYCSSCIKEWAARTPTCPCCNARLDTARLVRDCHTDALIEIFKEEREKAESAYFDKVINEGASGDEGQRTVTPVEKVLKKHLKRSLVAHEAYFQDLSRQFESRTHRLELDLKREMERLQLDGLPPSELQQRLVALETSMAQRKAAMEDDISHCQQLVADAFDLYLSTHIPDLDVLPVKVTLVLADKNIRIPDITLQPGDVLTEVQTAVEQGLTQRGDRVIRWQADGGKVLLVSPLSRQEHYDVAAILEELGRGGESCPGIQQLSWVSKPVLQHHMRAGSEVVLWGCVVCESDLPKVCYAQRHREQGPATVDYFLCRRCDFKWICRSCIQVCHKDLVSQDFVCWCGSVQSLCVQITTFPHWSSTIAPVGLAVTAPRKKHVAYSRSEQ